MHVLLPLAGLKSQMMRSQFIDFALPPPRQLSKKTYSLPRSTIAQQSDLLQKRVNKVKADAIVIPLSGYFSSQFSCMNK
ncbi:hypothetical protein [Phormidium sp. CCY1219]|uniref:hypothetical protein n=1 Tax=Phormidium sp. CCY1219 TaxID=2886104 RepID=UPI002D1F48CC|nr:hypothetical protein [Phormidium sp. CCY1219]MEB3831872.1 hypothetical protein [Phormidium sp. CCY1219]